MTTSPSYRTIVDFVVDTAFVDWIIRPTPEATTYWQRWQKDHPQLRDTLEDARRAVLLLQFRGADFTREELDRLLYRIDNNPDNVATDLATVPVVLGRPPMIIGAIAALTTIILIVLLFVL